VQPGASRYGFEVMVGHILIIIHSALDIQPVAGHLKMKWTIQRSMGRP